MAILDFPSNPTGGQEYNAPNNIVYVWNSAKGIWTCTTGSSPPIDPPSINTPSIVSPADGATGVGTSSGLTITSSAYSGVNSPGTHQSSDWEVSSDEPLLTSTNAITAVVQSPETLWVSRNSGQTDTLTGLAYGGSPVRFISVGKKKVTYSSTGSVWSSFGEVLPDSITSLESLNGYFVATRDDNSSAVYYSSEGSTWSTNTLSGVSNKRLTGSTYGSSLYAVVGENGLIATGSSLSGSWTEQSSGTSENLSSIAFGGGVFVAVGNNGKVLRSTDGSTWTTIPYTSFGKRNFTRVVYGGGKFVAICKDTFKPFSVISSSDGITWSISNISGVNVGGDTNSLVYGGGYFLVTGRDKSTNIVLSFYSSDGVTWLQGPSLPTTSKTVVSAYGGGVYATGNSITIYTKTGIGGGTTTLTISAAPADGFLLGDTVSNGLSGGSAASGTISSIGSSQVVVSPNSSNWLSGQNLHKGVPIVESLVDTSNLTSYAISSPPLLGSTLYYARVRYRSDSAPPILSDWSAWSEFTTDSFSLDIGAPFGGGYIGGFISYAGNGVPTHVLIVAPKSTETTGKWGLVTGDTAADGLVDGFTNSQNLNTTNYPAAHYCRALTTGGYNDWYLPSPYEMMVLYGNLKPTTDSNALGSDFNEKYGEDNIYACPPTTTTTSVPGQTSAVDFQVGGSQEFEINPYYWASAEDSSGKAWAFRWEKSGLAQTDKTDTILIRAIRKVAL